MFEPIRTDEGFALAPDPATWLESTHPEADIVQRDDDVTHATWDNGSIVFSKDAVVLINAGHIVSVEVCNDTNLDFDEFGDPFYCNEVSEPMATLRRDNVASYIMRDGRRVVDTILPRGRVNRVIMSSDGVADHGTRLNHAGMEVSGHAIRNMDAKQWNVATKDDDGRWVRHTDYQTWLDTRRRLQHFYGTDNLDSDGIPQC